MKLFSYFSLITFMALATITYPLPANAEEDVLGWKNIKWGMKKFEIKKLYPSIECGKKFICNPQESIEIANNEYNLAFTFDGVKDSSNIIKVSLMSIEKNEKYNDVYGLLSGKYGKHSSYSKGVVGDEYLWFRKSGQIKLTVSNNTEIGLCEIEYIKASDETSNL